MDAAPAARVPVSTALARWLFPTLGALACAGIVAVLAAILFDIVVHGLRTVSWEFLSRAPSGGMMHGGIFPAIFGTIALVFLMTLAVLPLGVGCAIYLSEYARRDSLWVTVVRHALENLAGVPAIVFGLFGLGFFVQFVGRGLDQVLYGGAMVFGQPAMIWAALTLAILTLPTVVVTTEEALRAVPPIYREAAFALGATRWQVVRRVVLPNATSGILTGTILAISRGGGEVAPIMFTGAAYFLPYLPTRVTDQFMVLGYHVYVMATQSPDVEATKPVLYGTVLVLLLLTFALNLTAILFRARIRRRLRSR
jgi:phosphate transport system permease protein